MSASKPHYLLFSDVSHDASSGRSAAGGRWRFVLEAVDGSSTLEACDDEHDLAWERLELLSVVRGLEALPQPSRVTLVTASRYVWRGLRFGLAEWRENDWQWEHFGRMSAVKNADLWQRLDRAARIHDVQCRTLRIDGPHHQPACAGDRAAAVATRPRRQRPSSLGRSTSVPSTSVPSTSVPSTSVPSISSRSPGSRSLAPWMWKWFGRAGVSAAQLL